VEMSNYQINSEMSGKKHTSQTINYIEANQRKMYYTTDRINRMTFKLLSKKLTLSEQNDLTEWLLRSHENKIFLQLCTDREIINRQLKMVLYHERGLWQNVTEKYPELKKQEKKWKRWWQTFLIWKLWHIYLQSAYYTEIK
jgi:hypothetical protein